MALKFNSFSKEQQSRMKFSFSDVVGSIEEMDLSEDQHVEVFQLLKTYTNIEDYAMADV